MNGSKNVVYIYNGIFSTLKEEGGSTICGNRDEPGGQYAK